MLVNWLDGWLLRRLSTPESRALARRVCHSEDPNILDLAEEQILAFVVAAHDRADMTVTRKSITRTVNSLLTHLQLSGLHEAPRTWQ